MVLQYDWYYNTFGHMYYNMYGHMYIYLGHNDPIYINIYDNQNVLQNTMLSIMSLSSHFSEKRNNKNTLSQQRYTLSLCIIINNNSHLGVHQRYNRGAESL